MQCYPFLHLWVYDTIQNIYGWRVIQSIRKNTWKYLSVAICYIDGNRLWIHIHRRLWEWKDRICITMIDYLLLYMTMYGYIWQWKRKFFSDKEREREKARKSYLNLFKWFKRSQMFHTFQQTSSWGVLRSSTLFTFVYLCSYDASMHKFCVCLKMLSIILISYWDNCEEI